VGSSKTTTTGESTQTTTPTATAEETELNKLNLELRRQTQGGLISAQTSGLDLVTQLLGGQELPGFLSGLPGGLSEEVQQSIVGRAGDVNAARLQQLGISPEAGVSQAVQTRSAADIFRQAEEFNIGNRLNLLNLALSGQAQVQQPISGFNAQLGGQLAGLRSTTQTGQTSQTQLAPNPFLQSFQTSFGQTLGSGAGAFPFGFASGFLGG